MENVLNNKIQSYSHGMRQKIVIMGTLLHNPQNLILDEPMTGLDPRSSFDLKRIMREHTKQNKSVFSQLIYWKLQRDCVIGLVL